MRVLILGSGGREAALAWACAQSLPRGDVLIAPGNAGLAKKFKCFPEVSLKAEAFSAIAGLAKSEAIDLVVVGPDDPLATGIVNALTEYGLTVFGPTREASRLEWSKGFAKEVMSAAGVPTARAQSFSDLRDASRFLDSAPWAVGTPFPWVVKADGLALGKGVQVCETREEAKIASERLLTVSGSILLEERLFGEELSWFAFCDGERVSLFEPARDYKRLFDNHLGPNTGGMGAFSPVPGIPEAWTERVRAEVFEPVVREMKARGTPYRGLLYAGLMVDVERDRFWVIEFNARFGDPETQVLLPRLRFQAGDPSFAEWCAAVARGDLSAFPKVVPFKKTHAVGVVGAAPGYPEISEKGIPVPTGMFGESPESEVFWAGVSGQDGELVSSGGRVLLAVGLGETSDEARTRAYVRLKQHHFRGMQFRKDIALS